MPLHFAVSEPAQPDSLSNDQEFQKWLNSEEIQPVCAAPLLHKKFIQFYVNVQYYES